MSLSAVEPTLPGVGGLLRAWRQQRRLSQLELSSVAEVSTRHLSRVETGLSRPGREFLLHVAEHLDVPLRARNDLLVAAGHPPAYAESDLAAPHLAAVSATIDMVLGHHEPFPALVADRGWDLVRANQGALALLDGVDPALLGPPLNVLRVVLHPDGLGPRVVNMAAFSGHVMGRLRRQAALTGESRLLALMDELAGFPGVVVTEPESAHAGAVVPLVLRTPAGDLSFYSTQTVFGTAADVTLAELTVEAFYPADARTAELVRQSAAG
jgi:transcriptional regulator with XRE-family HTH domain